MKLESINIGLTVMLYESEVGNLRAFLTGDAMVSRRLRPFSEPDYLELAELIRSGDVAFTNLEATVRNPSEGWPTASLGTPMTTEPSLLEDLKWMGFNLASGANNHAVDYGPEGCVAMTRHLRAAGIPTAGIGENLALSRAPAYLDTAAGRIALVAATSFLRPGDAASHQRPDSPGRPGVNPLHFTKVHTVDAPSMKILREISEKLGLTQDRARMRAHFFSEKEAPSDDPDNLTLFGANIRLGSKFNVATRVDQRDAAENLRWIAEARRQADWVIFSFHYHELGFEGRLTAATETGLNYPADFVIEFARQAIEAGADMVVGHGPHRLLGAEIYKGRPIFYSLGNFFLQNDTVQIISQESYNRFDLDFTATPADFLDARTGKDTRGMPSEREFWETLVVECIFDHRRLSMIKLHPVDLGFGRPRAQRGRPVRARGEQAESILNHFTHLASLHNTAVVRDGESAFIPVS